MLAYANSFHGAFVFDDTITIANNPGIRHLWPQEGKKWLSQRCFTDLTLALNYATGKLNPADYHATNLLIHLAAALLLYGIIRRTFMLSWMAERFRAHSSEIAFFAASIWMAHPLTTSAITYLSQRYESLMGMFYLLTLYCVIRGFGKALPRWSMEGRSPLRPRPQRTVALHEQSCHGWVWYGLAVLACALGMAGKEVMITAPLVVLIYDRIFLSQSFREALKQRRGLYTGLAATWVLLGLLMVFCASQSEITGIVFDKTGTPDTTTSANVLLYYLRYSFFYALTQCGVIIHYLRLSFWPHPLCIDYSWPVVEYALDALPSVMFVGLLGILSLITLKYCPPVGFLGLSFFIILSPTSSFIPRPDCAFEHRMYLPLAMVVVGTVIGVYELPHWLSNRRLISLRVKTLPAVSVLTIVVLALAGSTHYRNRAYYSEEAMWRDVVRTHPENARAQSGLIQGLLAEGKFVDAEVVARRLLERVNTVRQSGLSRRYAPPNSAEHFYFQANNQLGQALLCQGKTEEALKHISEAIKTRPDDQFAHNCNAVALSMLGRPEEAIQEWAKAIAIDPDYGKAHENIATAFEKRGEFAEAVDHYWKAIESGPGFVTSKFRLSWLLATCHDDKVRDGRKAVEMAISVCEDTNYGSPNVLDLLAAAYAEAGQFDDAVRTVQKALNMASKTDGSGLGPDELAGIKRRLRLYQQGKPFRGKKEDTQMLDGP